MTTYNGVAGRLHQTIDDLQRVVDRVASQIERAARTSDDAYFDAVALNLQGFYTAIEQAIESVAVNIDGGLPKGPNWHQELLLQASFAIDPIRPAVISPATRDCLDGYRRFRHVVRNAYAFNLEIERVAALARRLPDCHALVTRDFEAFIAFLMALNGQPDPPS